MLRIFRGEQRAEDAAQPGQPTQDGTAEGGQDAPSADAASTPQAAGEHSATQAHSDGAAAEAKVSGEGSPEAGGTPPGDSTPDAGDTPPGDGSQDAGGVPPGGASESEQPPAPSPRSDEPGFLERGRVRRRTRFLRAARELAYRDLGGLVFDLHRFGQRNDEVVKAKLDTLSRIDSELRSLEAALSEHRSVTVLREAGVAACPRCAAIHGSGDRFCPTCGLAVDQSERPIAAPNAPAQVQPERVSASAPPLPAPAAPAPLPDSTAGGGEPAAKPADAAGEPRESQTEVIRSGRTRPRAAQQRTVAFDPISPAAGPSQDRGGEDRGGIQDRP